jgi:hypothetical protein
LGNRNPANKFKKGQTKTPGSGRKVGQSNILTADVRSLIRQAAEETGYKEMVPVRVANGMPTGELEEQVIEAGELGYLKWLADKHPAQFAALYGRIIPFEMNVKSTVKPPRIPYQSLDEIRAALRAKGIDPDVIQRAMMVQ